MTQIKLHICEINVFDNVTGVGRHRYNKKAILLFRKDFWKEFLK